MMPQGLSTWIVAPIALNEKFGLNRLMEDLFAKEEMCIVVFDSFGARELVKSPVKNLYRILKK